MPTHYLKINTHMVCGGCTNTVEKALLQVPNVSAVSVSLDSQTAKVDTTNDNEACQCSKTADGKCPCGDNCLCMEKALLAACDAVGFGAAATTAEAHRCGGGDQGQKCGAPDCTCGDDCQCGTTCQCAGCPGSTTATSCGKGKCDSLACTCGPNCQCGATCTCATCPRNPAAMRHNVLTHISLGVALFAVGWMASKKLGR